MLKSMIPLCLGLVLAQAAMAVETRPDLQVVKDSLQIAFQNEMRDSSHWYTPQLQFMLTDNSSPMVVNGLVDWASIKKQGGDAARNLVAYLSRSDVKTWYITNKGLLGCQKKSRPTLDLSTIKANGKTGYFYANDGTTLIAALQGKNIVVYNPPQASATDGLQIYAPRIILNGGGNIVAAGAGNIVAAGAGNIVAAGAGNVSSNGGGIVAAGAGNWASPSGNLVGPGGSSIVAAGAGNIVAAGAGNLVNTNGGNIATTASQTVIAALLVNGQTPIIDIGLSLKSTTSMAGFYATHKK